MGTKKRPTILKVFKCELDLELAFLAYAFCTFSQ